MSWLQSFFVGLPTGILTLFAAGFIATLCVQWYRIPSFEGQAGYYVVTIAILGGLAGFVIGLVTGLVVTGGGGGYFKALGNSAGIALLLSVVILGFCRLFADVPPKIEGRELMLEVELRLPVGENFTPGPKNVNSCIVLGSVVNHRQRNSRGAELDLDKAKLVDGRWVIPGSVFLYTQRGYRSLSIQLDGKSRDGFLIPLPARPGKAFEQWSEWGPRGMSKTEPWPDSKISYRFRVQRVQPPPPEPDPKVVEAEAFAALKPEAPLETWLPFMKYDSPDERVQTVMAVVEPRQAELAALIRSTNEPHREMALSAVPRLTSFKPELTEAVLAEGRDIAEGIKLFNDMNAEDPKFWDVQIQLRSRFNYWKRAWWTIQQRLKLDGRPPVQEIHDLAQIRAQGTSMDEIVLNASVILDALKPAPATP